MAYAIIDSNNVCFAVMDTPDARAEVMSVEVPYMDTKYIGATYENGVLVVNPTPEQPEEAEPQPTNAEIKSLLLEVQEQNLILMEALADMYEAGSN